MRLKKPDQWEVLFRVVREVVDDGVLSEQEGVGWAVGWQIASKIFEEKVVRGLQMVSTEAAGSLNGLSVAFAQCHA